MTPRRLGLRIATAALAAAASLTAIGCSSVAPNTIVNGWSIGDVQACNDPRCAAQIPVVLAALEEYRPDHPTLVEMTIHAEGVYPRGDGTAAEPFRTEGCCHVALFQFADGSIYAIGVGYLATSDEPVAVPRGREFLDPPQTPFRAE